MPKIILSFYIYFYWFYIRTDVSLDYDVICIAEENHVEEPYVEEHNAADYTFVLFFLRARKTNHLLGSKIVYLLVELL